MTGHSLGGALAKLAAYDIAVAARDLPIKVHVANYTFGAPRVGNHAFAEDFNAVVPDSWDTINDQVRHPGRHHSLAVGDCAVGSLA